MQDALRRFQDVRSWREAHHPSRVVRIFALLLIVASASLLPGAASPQDKGSENSEVSLDACGVHHNGQSEPESCFGKAVDACLESFPDEPVIPLTCWQEELTVWDELMAQTYAALLQDLEQRGYGMFIGQIETAQSHWLIQSRLDCDIQVAATPRTHETMNTSCLAEAAHGRTVFLQGLIGADWADAP